MKLLVLARLVPFVADSRRDLLVRALTRIGCAAEAMRVPWDAENLPDAVVIARALSVSNVDRVVALDLPAGLVRGPGKILWLAEAPGPDMSAVAAPCLAEAQHRFAVTRPLAGRLFARTGIPIGVLPVPEANDVAGWDAVAGMLCA